MNFLEKKIILASSSPRRKQLLEQIGLKFKIYVGPFDEKTLSKDLFKTIEEFVCECAKRKALSSLENCKENVDIVIGRFFKFLKK